MQEFPVLGREVGVLGLELAVDRLADAREPLAYVTGVTSVLDQIDLRWVLPMRFIDREVATLGGLSHLLADVRGRVDVALIWFFDRRHDVLLALVRAVVGMQTVIEITISVNRLRYLQSCVILFSPVEFSAWRPSVFSRGI